MKEFGKIGEKNLTKDGNDSKFKPTDTNNKSLGGDASDKEFHLTNNQDILEIKKKGEESFVFVPQKDSKPYMNKDRITPEQKKELSLKRAKNIYDYINDADFMKSGLNNRQYRLLKRIELFSRKEKEVPTCNNYFAQHLKCSVRTIIRDLHLLEKKALITIKYSQYTPFGQVKTERLISLNYSFSDRRKLVRGHDKMSHNNNIINNINKEVEEEFQSQKAVSTKSSKQTNIKNGHIYRYFEEVCDSLKIRVSEEEMLHESSKFFHYWSEMKWIDAKGKQIKGFHVRSKVASWVNNDLGIFNLKITEKRKMEYDKIQMQRQREQQRQLDKESKEALSFEEIQLLKKQFYESTQTKNSQLTKEFADFKSLDADKQKDPLLSYPSVSNLDSINVGSHI